jgi:hypothetical protein
VAVAVAAAPYLKCHVGNIFFETKPELEAKKIPPE